MNFKLFIILVFIFLSFSACDNKVEETESEKIHRLSNQK